MRRGRLVHLQGIPFDEAPIGRDDIPEPEPDHISRDQFPGRHTLPLAATPHLCLEGKGLLQGRNGIPRLVLLPETHDGIHHEEDDDDSEILPVPHERREQRRRLDHPWDRPPEEGEEFPEGGGLPFLEFVVANLFETSGSLAGEKSFGRRREPAEKLDKGDRLQRRILSGSFFVYRVLVHSLQSFACLHPDNGGSG